MNRIKNPYWFLLHVLFIFFVVPLALSAHDNCFSLYHLYLILKIYLIDSYSSIYLWEFHLYFDEASLS